MTLTPPFDELRARGVVPVAVIERVADAEPLGAMLVTEGLPCIEVTFRTEAAPEAISALTAAHPSLLVGAGTVMSVEHVDAAVASGARFAVSPVLDPVVVARCSDHGIPFVPGVATATEVYRATELGIDVVKLFPAGALGGVDAVRSLASVMPHVRFLPTGGIDDRVLADYLVEPTVLACGGTWLTPRAMVAEGRMDEIRQRVRRAVEIVRSVRLDA